MISEINLLEDDNAWWVDFATRHVCKNKNFFKTMKPVDDGIVLFMRNSTTAPILGIGDVETKIHFWKYFNVYKCILCTSS